MPLRAIVGLGNPGRKYAKTRHNIGFDVVDAFAGNAATWDESKAAFAQATTTWAGQKILLIKPLTFMNLSGEPLSQICSYYKITAEDLIVVHDEIDLPFATTRLKLGGGDGGHKGIRSIIGCMGSKDFARLRMGVGRPPNPQWDISDWVLGKFSPDESREIEISIQRAVQILQLVIEKGFLVAQNLTNVHEGDD